MVTTLVTVIEIAGVILMGAMISLDILAVTRARASLIRVPARIIRRRR